jgi:hypothetical protein
MTVSELRDVQKVWPKYKGLISCMNQEDVVAVEHYLKAHHPTVSYRKAISDESSAARDALRLFREDDDDTDLLITVRMAFVGYSCNRITVIGCLTNYRDKSHLEQLFGRGFRVDSDSGIAPQDQRCRIIAPNDRPMREFIDYLRAQEEIGISKRTGGGTPPPGEATSFVEDAKATTTTVRGLSGDIGPDDVEQIDALKRQYHLAGTVGDFAKMLKDLNFGRMPRTADVPPQPAQARKVVLTEQEQIQEYAAEAYRLVRDAAENHGIRYFVNGKKNAEYPKQIASFTTSVHDSFGIKGRDALVTATQAAEFRDFCRNLAAGSAL